MFALTISQREPMNFHLVEIVKRVLIGVILAAAVVYILKLA
jgi:hypothetical protein